MKNSLALIFALYALCAQDKPGSATGQRDDLQTITNPKDERLNVFFELESKGALWDDTKALAELGRYYCNGQFPVLKNLEKGKAYLTRGASLGDKQCAMLMWEYTQKNGDRNDPEHVIDTQKWHLICTSLGRVKSEFVRRPDNVSEASWAEAKARSAAFLAGVKAFAPVSDNAVGIKKTRVTGLKFESLSLFDAHRKNICSAYFKASSPIYNKGEGASEDEKAAFIVAAAEVARLQAYIGKSRRLSLSSQSNAAMRTINSEKMNECYAKMSAAKIATTLPATRAELNEASIYINALGQLMQLPVSLDGGY